ncbi:MAG: murein biosynthesis integral membrane protein MurJ, partial [Spirochaetota bacterium]
MVMLGTLCSRLLGFLRNAIIALYFGAGEKADVLNFIQAIPLLLRRLAAEGSLETALVPELARSREQDPSGRGSQEIWRKLIAIQWSIIFPLCLLLWIFPRQIIELLTEFPKEEQTILASRMLYYVSPYIFLLSQSVLLGALLSSQQRFTRSSFTPLLSSLAVISSTILLQKSYGVFAVLMGMLGGIILQLLFLLPPILKAGYSFLPDFRLRTPAIVRIRQVWLPLWLSTGILALMQFTANYLASQSHSGSVSALANALIFFQLPQGLIYASIAKVCLPQMSHESQIGSVLRYGLSQLLILMLPATVILWAMSQPLIAVAFQRGAFGLQDTLRTAEVLRYYALGSLPIGVFRFLQQYFYARSQTSMGRSQRYQPLFQTFWVALLDIPLSVFLIKYLGVIALPIANTFSYSVVALYTYYIA